MRVGSLFTGYGGLEMAVGGDLAWYAEVEPAACKVLAAHYPGVPNLGDVTTVDWSLVEPVDVITGGYPCQPFSTAGKRKGKDDDRHLWPYVRDAIGAIRPRWAVLENVRGHLTLGFTDVLADLAALGLSARWGVVRAADAGAPHNRARLFIVADTERTGLQGQPWPWLVGAGESAASRDDLADTEGGRWGARAGLATTETRHQAQGVGDCGTSDAASAERRTAKPNDLQARGATELGERASDAADAASGDGQLAEGGLYAELAYSDRGQCHVDWGQYAPAITRWEHVIGRPAPAPTVRRNDSDRLSPAFVEWMMGLPEGHVTGHGLSPSAELKMLGNGVVPQQARLALDLLGAL